MSKIYNGYKLLELIGVPATKLPAPGSMPIHVAWQYPYQKRAALDVRRVLRMLGYSLTNERLEGAFVIDVKLKDHDYLMLPDYLDIVAKPMLKKMIHDLTDGGVSEGAARLKLIEIIKEDKS